MGALEILKAELERFGETFDAETPKRELRMFNITRDTGEFLDVLVRAIVARQILEIGTSNGYSTLWLAKAARDIGGTVTTVESADAKVALASANFGRSGLASFIDLIHDDAGRVLSRGAEGAYDLVFLDSERVEYPGWWPDLRRVIRPGGVLVVDNATFPPGELDDFMLHVRSDRSFCTCLLPVGKGEFIAVKSH